MSSITTNSTQTITGDPAYAGSPAGSYSFRAQGSVGGGTLTVGFSFDGGTTVTPYSSDSVLTAAGGFEVRVSRQEHVYVKLEGATAPNINIDFQPIERTN